MERRDNRTVEHIGEPTNGDVRNAEVFVLDAGHFALDTDADTIAAKIDSFLAR